MSEDPTPTGKRYRKKQELADEFIRNFFIKFGMK